MPCTYAVPSWLGTLCLSRSCRVASDLGRCRSRRAPRLWPLWWEASRTWTWVQAERRHCSWAGASFWDDAENALKLARQPGHIVGGAHDVTTLGALRVMRPASQSPVSAPRALQHVSCGCGAGSRSPTHAHARSRTHTHAHTAALLLRHTGPGLVPHSGAVQSLHLSEP